MSVLDLGSVKRRKQLTASLAKASGFRLVSVNNPPMWRWFLLSASANGDVPLTPREQEVINSPCRGNVQQSDCSPSWHAGPYGHLRRHWETLGLERRAKDINAKRTFSDLLIAEQIEDNKRNEKKREEFEAKRRAAASAPATEPPNADVS
jgi:hypothetical protein